MDRADVDRAAQAAAWYKGLKETCNEAFLPLFFDKSKILVLKGGGGSGKSIFAGRFVLERVTTEPGHRWLVCRKVAKTLRESCFAQLREQIAEHYPHAGARVNKGDMVIDFANGSRIIFVGLDDVEKLKSIYAITGVWIEEASEILESDYNQLTIRLRGETKYRKQIILTFNPISITHWLKKRFFDRHEPGSRIHESTYKDNRFLPEEDIKTLEGFKDTDPYYYQVYALGQWGVTGKTVFPAALISARLERLKPPVRRGSFAYKVASDGVNLTDIRWIEDPEGPITVYREPEPGTPYVVGGDTAGEGSDWFVGQVLDNVTGEQVAVLRHQFDEDVYAEQMYCLGRWYNWALEGPECNFSTYPVKRLALMNYPKLYVREVPDDYTGRTKRAFGYRTDSLTRPVMLAELIRVVRDRVDSINDEGTLLEMLTFVRNEEKGLRMEAEPGAHDDRVMALAIAHQIRSQQDMTVRAGAGVQRRTAWTDDMWEDYRGASEEMRAVMLKEWGEPT